MSQVSSRRTRRTGRLRPTTLGPLNWALVVHQVSLTPDRGVGSQAGGERTSVRTQISVITIYVEEHRPFVGRRLFRVPRDSFVSGEPPREDFSRSPVVETGRPRGCRQGVGGRDPRRRGLTGAPPSPPCPSPTGPMDRGIPNVSSQPGQRKVDSPRETEDCQKERDGSRPHRPTVLSGPYERFVSVSSEHPVEGPPLCQNLFIPLNGFRRVVGTRTSECRLTYTC